LAVVFAPVYFIGVMLGAGAGGYFHNKGSGSGAMIGGLAGILATIPFILFLVAFILYGFSWFALQDVSTQFGSEDFFAGAGAIVGVISVFALIFNGICGLIGGLIGGSVSS
jgi:predicted RND superfamily exporter protein